MKTSLAIFGVSLSVATAHAQIECCGDNKAPGRKAFRDAATHESIVENGRGRVDPISAMAKVEVPEEVKNSKPFKPKSLIERSEILKRGNVVTLVPKRAVIHLPSDLRGVIGLPDNPTLVGWEDFYLQNRAWLRTVEVTRAQAEGKEPLPEAILESFKDCRQVVVATYQAGPISVTPYVEPVEETETANTQTP